MATRLYTALISIGFIYGSVSFGMFKTFGRNSLSDDIVDRIAKDWALERVSGESVSRESDPVLDGIIADLRIGSNKELLFFADLLDNRKDYTLEKVSGENSALLDEISDRFGSHKTLDAEDEEYDVAENAMRNWLLLTASEQKNNALLDELMERKILNNDYQVGYNQESSEENQEEYNDALHEPTSALLAELMETIAAVMLDDHDNNRDALANALEHLVNPAVVDGRYKLVLDTAFFSEYQLAKNEALQDNFKLIHSLELTLARAQPAMIDELHELCCDTISLVQQWQSDAED